MEFHGDFYCVNLSIRTFQLFVLENYGLNILGHYYYILTFYNKLFMQPLQINISKLYHLKMKLKINILDIYPEKISKTSCMNYYMKTDNKNSSFENLSCKTYAKTKDNKISSFENLPSKNVYSMMYALTETYFSQNCLNRVSIIVLFLYCMY